VGGSEEEEEEEMEEEVIVVEEGLEEIEGEIKEEGLGEMEVVVASEEEEDLEEALAVGEIIQMTLLLMWLHFYMRAKDKLCASPPMLISPNLIHLFTFQTKCKWEK